MTHLDLTDPLVREMADSDHLPTETFRADGPSTVHCRACGQAWPCPTRQALRALAEIDDRGTTTPRGTPWTDPLRDPL